MSEEIPAETWWMVRGDGGWLGESDEWTRQIGKALLHPRLEGALREANRLGLAIESVVAVRLEARVVAELRVVEPAQPVETPEKATVARWERMWQDAADEAHEAKRLAGALRAAVSAAGFGGGLVRSAVEAIPVEWEGIEGGLE